MTRLHDVWQSFRALPTWVQWWVAGVLVPTNAAPFLLLDTMSGRAGALASIIVLAGNVPLMLVQRGMSRLLSVPHLLAWTPLVAMLAARLLFAKDMTPAESVLAMLLLVVNGSSLLFDTVDAWRWLCGQREIAGHDDSHLLTEPCT
jgi:hypothetical protein